MRLDLNGIAKGYALDRAASALRIRGVTSAFLDLGGQLLAFGSERRRVAIRDPRDPSAAALWIELREGSLSTSGDYERYFVHDGKRYSHLVDPRSGWTAEGSRAVTVWAPDATAADAWSTALFVAGPEEGKRLIAERRDLTAVWLGETTDTAYGWGGSDSASARAVRICLPIDVCSTPE
jgi:thiamine biosynthesis lipoprotein